MHKATRIRYSRDSWKEKAVNRATENRDYRKKLTKKDQKITELENKLTRTEQQLVAKENISSKNSPQVVEINQAQETRTLCVVIVLHAVVSFRSVPKILAAFRQTQSYPVHWIPHFTSVINWTLRVGLLRLKQVSHIQEPWVAIVDHSIDIGIKKALVVLRVPLKLLEEKGCAPQLSDCECIGLRVCEKADYEVVSEQLSDIFESSGRPIAMIKDQAGNLSKGLKEYNKSVKGKKIATIDDIGHVMANALKAQFENTRSYQTFLKLTNSGAARLRQTSLAFLLPPKIRTKGRFQSISKLAKWGERILDILKESGRPQEGSTLEKIHEAMPKFSRMRPFLTRFATTTVVINEASRLLKNEGLNKKTYRECIELAETLPVRSKVRTKLLKWLKRHRSKQYRLGLRETPLLVSSDIIECLFGKFKYTIERSPVSDINRMALIIPALCGKPVDQECVANAFSHIKHEAIAEWEKDNISHTLRKERSAFFKGAG